MIGLKKLGLKNYLSIVNHKSFSKPIGASGSYIIMAKLFVFSGNPVQLNGGEILALSQVYLAGIGLPSWKAALISLKLLVVCDFELKAIHMKFSRKKHVFTVF